jgi:hypothetical protein
MRVIAHNEVVSEPRHIPSDDYDDENANLDAGARGWQPDPERPGHERWFDGERLIGRPHRSPDPFSALSPTVARSLWPGPNRAARVARAGLVFILISFAGQVLASTGAVRVAGVTDEQLVLIALGFAAIVAAATALAAVLALRASARLGGRGIATLTLTISVVLGLAPVLLLVAIGLAGGL